MGPKNQSTLVRITIAVLALGLVLIGRQARAWETSGGPNWALPDFNIPFLPVAAGPEAVAGDTINPAVRISSNGVDGDAQYDALNSAAAFNPDDDEYLVVWQGSANSGVRGEIEIWGQRIDATTGAAINSPFQISSVGSINDPSTSAYHPAVAYNDLYNHYLVVWSADAKDGSMVDNEFEIWGQLLDADGTAASSSARYSDMGVDGDFTTGAYAPAVASGASSEFLIVLAW